MLHRLFAALLTIIICVLILLPLPLLLFVSMENVLTIRKLGYELRSESANVYGIFKGMYKLTKPTEFSEAENARQAFMAFAKDEIEWLQTDTGKEWLKTHGTV